MIRCDDHPVRRRKNVIYQFLVFLMIFFSWHYIAFNLDFCSIQFDLNINFPMNGGLFTFEWFGFIFGYVFRSIGIDYYHLFWFRLKSVQFQIDDNELIDHWFFIAPLLEPNKPLEDCMGKPCIQLPFWANMQRHSETSKYFTIENARKTANFILRHSTTSQISIPEKWFKH